jgi:hypothetical protein
MELQDGTYTVLAHGDGPASADVVARHGGTPVGNGVFAFRGAAEAVRCAMASSRRRRHRSACTPARSPPATPRGRAVVLARRLASLARPGQVLASALVRELVTGDADLRFGEAREMSLPGLAERLTVCEVHWGERRRQALRVVIADDAALVRDGVAALLRDHGVDVAATVADPAELHEAVARHLTSRSSTSECRRRSPTKAWWRPSAFARASRTSACWSSPSTSMRTLSVVSPPGGATVVEAPPPRYVSSRAQPGVCCGTLVDCPTSMRCPSGSRR